VNQRAGKSHAAAMAADDKVPMHKIIDFVDRCAIALHQSQQPDAAFYFEQIAEYLRDNPHRGLKEDAGRVLGL